MKPPRIEDPADAFAPPASDAAADDPVALSPPRGYAALHRDVWAILVAAPVVFVVIPALVHLPIDWVAETIATARATDLANEVMTFNRVERFISFFASAWCVAITMRALHHLANGEPVDLARAIREGSARYGRALHISFSVGWRVAIGLVLFIVPGVVLWFRYALAVPAAVYDDLDVERALQESERRMVDRRLPYFSYAIATFFLYVPLSLFPVWFLPVETPPIVNALTSIPFNVLTYALGIGTLLFYLDAGAILDEPPSGGAADAADDDDDPRFGFGLDATGHQTTAHVATWPVGCRRSPLASGLSLPTTDGTRGVLIAAIGAVVSIAVGIGSIVVLVAYEESLL